MNLNLKAVLLLSLVNGLPLMAELVSKPKTKAIMQTSPKQPSSKPTPCAKKAQIPCEQTFKAANMQPTVKSTYLATWGNWYAAYLAKNASTAQNSPEWQALKRNAFINNPFCQYTPLGQEPKNIQSLDICLDSPVKNQSVDITDCQTNITNAYKDLTINYLADMQAYLSPATFPKFQNDPQNIQFNYATSNLNKALARLSKVCSISIQNEEPTTHFSGDIKDLGIIVNIINNSDKFFCVTDQDSVAKPIAHIVHGLNGVNLYTAALYQEPQQNNDQPILPACFAFFEIAPENMQPLSNQPIFTVGMYTGAQLVNFLKNLPRKDPAIFDMNGCPTSAEYLANPTDIYMVLIQDPTPASSPVRNQNQRIQAINLSVLTGPYLLTMQINETEKEQINPQTKQTSIIKILQPSLTTVQEIHKPTVISTPTQTSMEQKISATQSQASTTQATTTQQKSIDKSLLPMIILPQSLWNLPDMQLYWMLYTTSYIAALTDFSLFGAHSFGEAFEYFNQLGYFDTKYYSRFIIDLYNILKPGETLHDTNWLVGSALYESTLYNCNDIPGIYSAYNHLNKIVANSTSESNVNFNISFNPQAAEPPSANYFSKNGFNNTFNIPYLQLYTLIFTISATTLKESAFLKISNPKSNLYSIVWTNKQDVILDTQSIFLDKSLYNLSINLLNNPKSKEIKIPSFLTSFKNKQTAELKATYTILNNTPTFEITTASPIDKLTTMQTSFISKYPITNLSLQLYETYQVSPYSICNIWENENQPSFLQNLTIQNWQNGIYMVPTIINNKNFSSNNPQILEIVFYNYDKTILGTIQSPTTITHPVKAYNVCSNDFDTILDVYFSTGILLKYNPPQA